MTINGALSNAMSGLRAAGRASELVSSNVANALTPGYARRILALSSSSLGNMGGVRIDGVSRIVDEGIAADRRNADAGFQHSSLMAGFHTLMESLMGTPDDESAISSRMTGFERSLITAASRPDAPERLSSVAAQATDLVNAIRSASEGIQDARTKADGDISRQVNLLNQSLQQIETLNSQITSVRVAGNDTAALLDQRQIILDQIGAITPIRAVPRDHGQVAIYTEGGAILLDGSAAEMGFTRSNIVTPHMALATGTLSGLTINGMDVATDNKSGPLRGGSLAAQFEIRDNAGVAAQTELDALARDLIERFQDPAVDPTLTGGDAGIFTDAGAPFAPVNEVGVAQRLTLNTAVDPDEGGQAWRLRDGINALVPGNAGDATVLNNLKQALTTSRPLASGSFAGSAFSAIDFVSTLTSQFGAERTHSERQLSFASARFNELTQLQLADGVDTDAELQQLMLVQQAYAANARVITAADEMMQTLMRI